MARCGEPAGPVGVRTLVVPNHEVVLAQTVLTPDALACPARYRRLRSITAWNGCKAGEYLSKDGRIKQDIATIRAKSDANGCLTTIDVSNS